MSTKLSLHKFRSTSKTKAEIRSSPEDVDEFDNELFLHHPWLRAWLPEDFSPTYPRIEKFLFDDVYRLPIVTSRRHEIWAGAQMQAAKRLEKIIEEQADTFLESILVADAYLKQMPSTSNFLNYMLKWSQSEAIPSSWYKQSILNAYYLVGLIPYIFHFEGETPVLNSTLPSLELSELRSYCLQKLTDRLIAMPEFWWVIHRYQPGILSDFAEHFVTIHPFEINDVTNRLKLLTGLGAMQRLPYNRYQLTAFGASLAAEWAIKPDFGKGKEEVESETMDEADFGILDFGLW